MQTCGSDSISIETGTQKCSIEFIVFSSVFRISHICIGIGIKSIWVRILHMHIILWLCKNKQRRNVVIVLFFCNLKICCCGILNERTNQRMDEWMNDFFFFNLQCFVHHAANNIYFSTWSEHPMLSALLRSALLRARRFISIPDRVCALANLAPKRWRVLWN